jgi:hypothetical protein
MRTLAAVLTTLAVTLPGCASAAKQEIRAELESYYADFSARDWDAFESHFWPGATLATIWQPPGQPAPMVEIVTIPEFLARTDEGPDSMPIFEERMTGAFIIVDGPLAQAWVDYDAKFGEEGDLFEWSGIDAITLLRHAGEWRIVSISYASDQ